MSRRIASGGIGGPLSNLSDSAIDPKKKSIGDVTLGFEGTKTINTYKAKLIASLYGGVV